MLTGLVYGQSLGAQEYHDLMIKESIKVGEALNHFNSSLETDSAFLMHSSRADLKQQLDSSIAFLNTTPPHDNNEDWHQALLVQFQFYRDCADKEYVKFIDYSLRLAILDENEIQDFTQILSRLQNRESEIGQIVDESYKEYVDKYNITPVKNTNK